MAPYGSHLLPIAPNGLLWLSTAPYIYNELLMTPFDFHGSLASLRAPKSSVGSYTRKNIAM